MMVRPWGVRTLCSNEKLEMRNGGAAHKNQKRRGGLKLAVFSYRKPNP